MSIDSSIVLCSGCDFEYSLHPRPIRCHYHLPNGEVFEHYRQMGWCYSCEGVRDVEALPDIQNARAKIASLLDEKSMMRLVVWDRIIKGQNSQRIGRIDAEISDLQALVKAFEQRVSGPRCLKCSSTEISAGVADHEHSCGGKFFMESHPEGIRFFFQTTVIHLDGEGLLFDQDSPD